MLEKADQGDGKAFTHIKIGLTPRFFDDFRAALDSDQKSVSNDDQTAMRVAHTLKSVAASIGLDTVAQAAQALELACRLQGEGQDAGEEEVERLLKAIELALVPVISELEPFAVKEVLPEVSTLATEVCDVRDLVPELQRLAQLLAISDTEAEESFERIVRKMPAAVRLLPSLEELKKQLGCYDYQGATTTFDKLVEHLDLREALKN